MIGHKYTPTVGHTGSYAFGDYVRRNLGATVVELGIPLPSGVGSVNWHTRDGKTIPEMEQSFNEPQWIIVKPSTIVEELYDKIRARVPN